MIDSEANPNVISSNTLQIVMKASNLEKDDLSKIWKLAKLPLMGQITKRDFFAVLKAIALT